MSSLIQLIDRLEAERNLSLADFSRLIREYTPAEAEYLFAKARRIRNRIYGKRVFIRGLLEFTNVCQNDCFYCGIRRSNQQVDRFALDSPTILACCAYGYQLGFRTFVLQGGENPAFTDSILEELIQAIKAQFPDCAVTLSIGERSRASYQKLREAGADRYLLRQETANPAHYAQLHPSAMSWQSRINCLRDLKELGYQVGCGLMIGSPYQTPEYLAQDLAFMAELQPQMVGIGPFIPHEATPFALEKPGTLSLTLFTLGLLRLILPSVLLPATTALATIAPDGRKLGMQAGANVVMPNLSPLEARKNYTLYNNKAYSGDEAAEGLADLKQEMQTLGLEVVIDRGDFRPES